jgi:hypothetical protein
LRLCARSVDGQACGFDRADDDIEFCRTFPSRALLCHGMSNNIRLLDKKTYRRGKAIEIWLHFLDGDLVECRRNIENELGLELNWGLSLYISRQ